MPTNSISSSNALDLSQLEPPEIIQQLDYETVLAEMKADFAARASITGIDFDAFLESDPAIKLLEVAAYRVTIERALGNERARGLLIAYAKGANLDHLAALFGVQRLVITPADLANNIAEVTEDDETLRRRVLLAPDSYSVAGPESAYIFHALSADSNIMDASATGPQPDDIKALVMQVLADNAAAQPLIDAMALALAAATWPGQVDITVLSRDGDGSAPQAMQDAVLAAVSSDTVRPLTDYVNVQSAQIQAIDITADLWLFAGPDANLILAEARKSLDAFLLNSKRLGRDLPLSAISAALHVEGVQRVEITAPVADLAIDFTQVVNVDNITITNAGIAE